MARGRHWICPDCGRRRVHAYNSWGGSRGYNCDLPCEFTAHTAPNPTAQDQASLDRLADANGQPRVDLHVKPA